MMTFIMYPVHVFLSVLCQCGLQCIQPVKGAWNDRAKFQRLYPCWIGKPTAPDLCTKWRNLSVSLVILFPAACDKHAVMLNEDKFSRPRPRPKTSLRGRGRGRGQNHEAEAEDNFLSPLKTYKKSSLATMSHHFNLSSLLSS